ncbi:MAG: sterol desaturase family protein [Chitinophagaceae bacterium]|jgi:sterol desaturase/sphingolipid hydroxylase (fatty acid hydroxylase superfamily)|nr:sterol desaturase family protein [Chitinophagaceae bacterium]
MEASWAAWLKIAVTISTRYFLLALVAFAIFYWLFPGYFRRRKIQPRFPKLASYWRDIGFSLLSMLIFSFVAYACIIVLRPYNKMIYSGFAEFGWGWHLLSFVGLFLLHDAWFYGIHRLMHQPWLFRRIHLVHHLSTNPSPWTAYAFHPLEALLEAGIIPLAAFLLPVHVYLFGLFMLFQIMYNVYGHLGYELYPRRIARHRIGRWINTGVAHNQHHQYFKGNYGLYTLIWDRLFGTLRSDYEEAVQHYGQPKG